MTKTARVITGILLATLIFGSVGCAHSKKCGCGVDLYSRYKGPKR